jgi:hypothetical protein
MQIPTPAEAVERAKRIAALPKSVYVLGAGGRSPEAPTPFTSRDGKLGADCIGFAMWAWGVDRYQPKTFPFYHGWINTDSMLLDALGPQTTFEVIQPRNVFAGCAAVYPSLWKNGKMVRMGHIGLVTHVPYPKILDQWYKDVTVIDCAAALVRRVKGRAVGYRSAVIWNKPDARFVRIKAQPIIQEPFGLTPLPQS